jgi:hypothetical protein
MYKDFKDLLSAFHAHGVRYLAAKSSRISPASWLDVFISGY